MNFRKGDTNIRILLSQLLSWKSRLHARVPDLVSEWVSQFTESVIALDFHTFLKISFEETVLFFAFCWTVSTAEHALSFSDAEDQIVESELLWVFLLLIFHSEGLRS